MREPLQPFIDRSIIILNESTSAKTAARAMNDRHVGCVMVSDNHHHIVGIVTDRDLATQVLGFGLSPDASLVELMTKELISVDRHATIMDVLKMMELNGIRRIPVLHRFENGQSKCIGLVTLDDLMISEIVPCHQLSQIVRSQILSHIHQRRKISHHDESREQTLSHFYSVMARHMDLSKPIAERATYYLLKEFFQRLPYVNSAHMIAQLPSLLQKDMSNLPAGPDRSIHADLILTDMIAGFHVDLAEARAIIRGFWEGLKEALNPEIVAYIEALLPKDMRRLVEFSESPEGDVFISSFTPIDERVSR